MTDLPIIFSAPMVRALLDGRKTQTRRLAWRDAERGAGVPVKSLWWKVKPRDRLWVRETFAEVHPAALTPDRFSTEGRAGIPGPPPVTYHVAYRADGDVRMAARPRDEIDAVHPGVASELPAWTPSIHMPRWASRLTLVVTATKIERLQNISEDDATAEAPPMDFVALGGSQQRYPNAREAFTFLWVSLHGVQSWTNNPEVIAFTFDVHQRNIDRMP